jgi:hypothetical protein
MGSMMATALRFAAAGSATRFERMASCPRAAQELLLSDILRSNAATAFGREHGFASLRNSDDFRRAVPVRDYEALRPYVERIVAGERGVLTAEDPFMFALTSGTTAEPKLIPVTPTADRLAAGLARQWLARAAADHPDAFGGSQLMLVGRAVEAMTPAGTPCGSTSGMLYRRLPWAVRRAQAVPYDVVDIADYDTRYFVTLRFALGASPRLVATPNPSTLVHLAGVAATNAEALIRAVHDGTVGIASDDPAISRLAARLVPDPRRARELERAAAQRGGFIPANYWPDVKLIGCWTGGSAALQLGRLRRLYRPAAAVRDIGYLASEARMSLPLRDGTAAGALAIATNFYEFIPEEERQAARPRTLLAHELEHGRHYRVLLTTAGGLYRYDINDVVEVTGSYRGTPLIAFLRKAGDMTNLTGEKLHVNQCLLAVKRAQAELGCTIVQYRFVPDAEGLRYRIHVELEDGADASAAALAGAIDAALGAANLEYRSKRESRRLAVPAVQLMRRGWAEDAVRRHAAARGRDIQFKWRSLVPEPVVEDDDWIAPTYADLSGTQESAAPLPAWLRTARGRGRSAIWAAAMGPAAA